MGISEYMKKWDALRRARDDIRPSRPVSNATKVFTVLIDEIRKLKKEVELLKKRK